MEIRYKLLIVLLLILTVSCEQGERKIEAKRTNPGKSNDGRNDPSIHSNPSQGSDKAATSLLNSHLFAEYYKNITFPEWSFVDWTREGLLISLSTDKPVYKPGDTLEVRAYYFNYTDKSPISCEHFSLNYDVLDSNDNVVHSKTANFGETCEGVGELYKYEIPKDTKGGVYYIKANDYSSPSSIVKFRVREYHQKALVSLDYSQESFSPGENAEGKLTYRPIDDEEIPDGASFSITTAAGENKHNMPIGKEGSGYFSVHIPEDWTETSMFISFTLNLGEKTSTKTDILTVVQKDTVYIEFTAQSGPIVHGTCQKIYFEAFSDKSRAEHVDIMNAKVYKNPGTEEEVAIPLVSSKYHGRGDFELCSEEGSTYSLRYKGVDHLLNPKEYNEAFIFKKAETKTRVAMTLSNPVLENDESLDLTIQNENPDQKADLLLSVYNKKNLLYSQDISVGKQELQISIPSSKINLPNGGVVSVSLYEPKEKKEEKKDSNERVRYTPQEFPYTTVADAIAFILPSETLEIRLETDKTSYSPGEEVNYSISVYNKTTGSQVTDDVYVDFSITDLTPFLEIESKRQPPSLVSTVYLEKEVNITKEYEFLNANEYLDYLYTEDPEEATQAKEKIELLLGTQKWRLFKQDPNAKNDVSIDGDNYDLNNLYVKNEPRIMYKNLNLEIMPMIARANAAPNGEMEREEERAPSPEVEEEEAEDDQADEDSDTDGDDITAERVDFKQTQLFTDFMLAKKGQYKGSFKLGDLISKFRFEINTVSKKGVYGMHMSYFNVNKDFYIESNIPFFLTNQDRIDVPVTLHNSKNTDLTVTLSVSTNLKQDSLHYTLSENNFVVPKHSTKQVIADFKAMSIAEEEFKVKISAVADKDTSDSFIASTKVIGRGFPVTKSKSGFIGKSGEGFTQTSELDFHLPSTFETGSLELEAKLYTSQLGNILDALEKLIRDPHGCFEQTSSTTYPLVMALLLMENLPEKDDRVTQMIIEGKQKLSAGYNKLTTFETDTGGYEWFGESPGHESLTAYGLMQFHEMQQVLSEVDQGMIDRTTDWILGKRDGKGSFSLKSSGLDSFARPPPDLSDAYILWVLTSIGNNVDLDKEIKKTIEKAKAQGDSYLNALVANILYNVGRTKEAQEFAKILKSQQDKETGEVKRKDTSITRSSGTSLNIETTALATLAWMKDQSGQFADSTELGVKFIVQSVEDGKYGSTQGTILSLKVLIEFLKNSKLEGSGTFEISVDGVPIQTIDFSKENKTSSIEFDEHLSAFIGRNLNSYKKDSNHTVQIALKNFSGNEEKFRLSYRIQATYKDLVPKSNPNSDLKFSVTPSANDSPSKVGDVITYGVSLENKDQDNGKGMAVAIVRIPSCQEVDYNTLERLQNENKISYFEVFNGNSDVVLYWRSLQPGETKNIKLAMTQSYSADMCIFRPSKAYLYYDEDGSQVWTE